MAQHFWTAAVSLQAALLLTFGVCTLWLSQDLMLVLIHHVGEEYALGPENVVVTDSGGKLLTNPMAMLTWMLPFLFLGIVQITAAVSLVLLRWSQIAMLHDKTAPPSHPAL